jgi:hypothetical protein
LRQIAVHREEAQRNIRLATRQVADEVLERQHRAVDVPIAARSAARR